MTAIIKNNFRLQNARDFLENLKSHPRVVDGVGTPLADSITVSNNGSASGIGSASFSWTFNREDSSITTNEVVRADAIKGLRLNVGAHITDRNHYLFVGKPLPWGNGTPTEELYPAPANDTLHEEARVWDEMLSLKKIIDVSGSLVIPRFDWDATGKTIYAVFDDKDPDLYRQPTLARTTSANITNNIAGSFYVLNDKHELFVCLENKKNGSVGPSTEMPVRRESPTELVDYSTIDGYVWKYLTTISSSDAVKFLTDSWIPVKTLGNIQNDNSFQWAVEQAAVAGSVISFAVDNGGSGYVKTHKGNLTTLGTEVINGVTYGVAQLNALVGGAQPSADDDHYNDSCIHVAGSVYKIVDYSGSIASQRKIYIDGVWNNTTLTASDLSYEILPELVVVSNGSTAITAKPVVSESGVITRIIITNAGANATWASATVTPGSAGGSGALVRPVLGPWRGLGKDPEKDLGAFFVMLTGKLEYAEGSGDFTTSNDYRQLGIIRDVYERSNGVEKLATSQTLAATKRLLVSNVTPSVINGVFTPDEFVRATLNNGDVIEGRVLDYVPNSSDETKGVITFIQTPQKSTTNSVPFAPFTDGLSITGSTTGCSAVIDTAGVVEEEVVKFKGEILYLENRRRILRAPDQIEDIRAIIEF